MNEMKSFDYYTVVVRKDSIDTTDMDSEKVMMDLDRGKYFVLNDVASDIWENISKPTTIKSITNELMKKYDVDEVQCFESTIEFLTRLKNEELIIISE